MGDVVSASSVEPVAIIGIGCRFPGGVESAGGLWRLAAAGRSTVGPVPEGRWNAARLAQFHDPDLTARAGYGCFLDGDVWAWEPEAFAVAPSEQLWVDPQFRVLLEVSWEAVEHAGVPVDQLRGSRTGVYVGTYAPDNLFREARPVEDAPNSPYLFGNFTAGAAGRVAFALDLRGPVMVISTHCSSGLVALDTACGALTLGECDTALAGGVLLMLSPETHMYESRLLLSERGACSAFDARADGYVRGEGAGVLVLKRLADACRDGNRVLAVVQGSAVNNDGQASRLTAPSTAMQQQLFRRAVTAAGIDPGEVGLVEAHGPGTAVGDPIEYTSINAVYGRGRGRCALGSVKTNIGHSEPVSGIAGVIKAVQCLRRGAIPPNLNFENWNPSILRGEDSRLFVPTELTPWPVDGASRLAAVCSYGVTGTNAHVVLEAAPQNTVVGPGPAPGWRDGRGKTAQTQLFLLSGGSEQALAGAAGRLADWALGEDGRAVEPVDVAHTLALRRSHDSHRLVLIARGMGELAERARAFANGHPLDGTVSGVPVLPPQHPGPVFVFTGQGSQRPGMCRGLLAAEPVFAAVIDELDPLIAAEGGFSLRDMLTEPERLTGIDRIQPALFAVQVALAELWRSWGVIPAAVIGQSLGEVAAAVVAGVLPREDGAKVICRRSRLLATISGGAMASVMLGADEVRAALEAAGADRVTLGVLTSPTTTVISGDSEQITSLVGEWEAAGVSAKMIDVDVASHSPQVDPILSELQRILADLPAAEPDAVEVAFFSTVSENPRAPGPLDGSYWVRNQRGTVRFHGAVSAALAAGHRLFVECTAHPLAVRPILDTAQSEGIGDAVAVGTLQQGTDEINSFLSCLAAVHCAGHTGIDFASRYGDGELADLPATAWHRTRHGGDETPYRLVAPSLVGASQHPLLGGHVIDPDDPVRHWWQTPVSPYRLPWLADHQVAGVPVLPGTGFAEMILAAGVRAFGTDAVALTNLTAEAPLVLVPEPQVTTRLTVDGRSARAEVVSRTADGVLVHARATVRPLDAALAPELLEAAASLGDGWTDSAPADLYRHFRDRHNVFHGPSFTAVDSIRVHPTEDRAVARLRIADSARVSAWMMSLHPALADELVQTVVSVWLAHYATSPGPVVVAGFEEIRVYGNTGHARIATAEIEQADDLTCRAHGCLATADGTVVAEVRGLHLANITPAEERYAARLSHMEWAPAPVSVDQPVDTGGRWLVVADKDTAWAGRLARLLGRRTGSGHLLVLPPNQAPHEALDEAWDDATPPTALALVIDPAAGFGSDPAVAARDAVTRVIGVLQCLACLAAPPRLWLLWRGDYAPLAVAGLPGLLRVAAFEHPSLFPSGIEISGSTPLEAVVADLIAPDRAIKEIAWRHGVRHLARLQPGPGPHPSPVPGPVRTGGNYVVTGGLGGLGLLTVTWLTEQGAGRVVVCGRTAPDPYTAARLDALRATTDTDIAVVLGDIADPAVAEEAVKAAANGIGALHGVVHAAGLVEDATLANLTPELTMRVWRGKAEGAWALHQATLDHDLDFFVLYSSIAGLVGSPGQGAYAAANAFLDAFGAWRRSLGLPGTAIAWGAWSQVGRGQHLADRKLLMISPQDGITALHRVLAEGHHRIAYSPIAVADWIALYPALHGSTLLAPLLAGAPADGDLATSAVRESVLAADGAERLRLLQEFIIDQLRDLLGGTRRHIGPHTSMVLLGLDSLGAVQLQQRLQRTLRVEIKPGVIWVKPTPAALSHWLLEPLGLSEEVVGGSRGAGT
ncbi:type I polyketide synthase [Streptomyces syringium]|uniref:type I polyketide synthase n=1 Tax=Streptomyces syringium TaxID=76729 RepID=UPI00345519B1